MALGLLGAGIGLSFIVMGQAAPEIIARWSWRYCFYFLGAAQLSMVCFNLLFMRDKPEKLGLRPWGSAAGESAPAVTAGATPPVVSAAKEFAGTSRFWLIGLSYALVAGAVLSVTTFMVDYSKSELGFTTAASSLLASVHGLGQIVGVLGILTLSDLTGRRAMIIVSNLCIAACIVGIILSGGQRVVLIGCVGMFGAFYGATFPMYGACGGDYFRKEIMGSVIGLFTLFYGIGAIATSRFVGYLRDRTGSFVAPFAIAACLALASAAIMALVKKKPE
jgi:sugar phosphate permease